MTIQRRAPRHRATRLAELLRNVSYEVVPLASAEPAVLGHVPTAIPLTVTVTEARGMEATLRLTERLAHHGYRVAPHLAARLFADRDEVADVVARLRAADVRSVFVIGGDSARPAGTLADASALLRAIGGSFEEVGIAGYPEGHPALGPDGTDRALRQKAPMATRVITQICFDATATGAWAGRVAALGVNLPVHVGLPGPVRRSKLIRLSAGLGLGQSARFLRRQQNLLWRFLGPGGYDPSRLARRLGTATATIGTVRGLHVFTFNELARVELWRRRLLAGLSEVDERA